jgi:transcription elongation factor GreB
MSKAFVKDDAAEPETPEVPPPSLPSHGKNYITPEGFERLQSEKKHLLEAERPEVVKTVAWAASLGDRSENADYIYGKRRLRDTDQIWFGAEVRVRGASGERKVRIVGIDETDATKGYVSWISPMARALIKAREGDTVVLRTPAGNEQLEILEVTYP